MARLLDDIGIDGTNTQQHEAFVRRAIEALEPLKSQLWSHHDRCYGVLYTPSNPKYLATNWTYVSGLILSSSPTNSVCRKLTDLLASGERTLYRFPTLVEATIYLLANGNSNLEKWGLSEWKGISRSDRKALQLKATQSRIIEVSDSEDSDADTSQQLGLSPEGLSPEKMRVSSKCISQRRCVSMTSAMSRSAGDPVAPQHSCRLNPSTNPSTALQYSCQLTAPSAALPGERSPIASRGNG